jgi:hypothetical protein
MQVLAWWACTGLFAAAPARAAPPVALQDLRWFVVSGIGQGEDLAHYQGVIDQAMADARLLLQGTQGPGDVPCCVDLRRASITSIPAPTLQAVDSETDYTDMTTRCTQSGGGSCAFLVDSITYCDGALGAVKGCADQPSCAASVAGDDPTITLVVSLAAQADGSLGHELARQRGRNACLDDAPSTENPGAGPCSLMLADSRGGCLTAAECGRFRDAGNAVGGVCPCHTDGATATPDLGVCTDDAGRGLCSGGVCGAAGSDAAIPLLVAGGTASIDGDTPDERLHVAGLTGGWTALGATSGNAEITGMEYAASRRATYAVTADDQLLQLDPESGVTLATIGALPATGTFCDGATCHPTGAVAAAFYDSLAFDPGLTSAPGDDLLYAIRESESCRATDPITCDGGGGFCAGQLVSIDPDTAATTLLGDVDQLFCGGFPGLAFDAVRRKLYASGAAGVGLFEIDLACQPSFCTALEVDYGAQQDAYRAVLARYRPSLAYSAATDRLYRLGNDGTHQLYDVFDAETLLFAEPIGLAAFTAGGMAAPEPSTLWLGVTALAACGLVARRRRVTSRRGSLRRRHRAARRSCSAPSRPACTAPPRRPGPRAARCSSPPRAHATWHRTRSDRGPARRWRATACGRDRSSRMRPDPR